MDEIIEHGITMIKITTKSIDIINIYRAQNGSITRVVENIKKLLNIDRTTIIGGDINICFNKDRNNMLTKNLLSLGFSQLMKNPSHIDGGLIDHLYFRKIGEEWNITFETYGKYYSDHDAICTVIRKS